MLIEKKQKLEVSGQKKPVFGVEKAENLINKKKNICPNVRPGGGSIRLWSSIAARVPGNFFMIRLRINSIKF